MWAGLLRKKKEKEIQQRRPLRTVGPPGKCPVHQITNPALCAITPLAFCVNYGYGENASSAHCSCLFLCEQTTAENWRTAAVVIMRCLCVKRATALHFSLRSRAGDRFTVCYLLRSMLLWLGVVCFFWLQRCAGGRAESAVSGGSVHTHTRTHLQLVNH